MTEQQASDHQKRLLARMKDRSAVVGVVGLGYVGLPLAVEFGKAGFKVIGYDVSTRVIDLLIRCNATSLLRRFMTALHGDGADTPARFASRLAQRICLYRFFFYLLMVIEKMAA